MPSKISYEKEGAGVIITWSGCVSGDEIKRVNASIYAEGRLEKLRYQIWDFTQADRHDVSNQEVYEFALQDRAAARTNPDQIAALVGSARFFSGYDRIFHIYEQVWSGFTSKTFFTMEEAREWISSMIAEE